MIMEILKEREMKLLSRKRVTLLIEEKGATPSRQELIGQVASKFKVKENLWRICICNCWNSTYFYIQIPQDRYKN